LWQHIGQPSFLYFIILSIGWLAVNLRLLGIPYKNCVKKALCPRNGRSFITFMGARDIYLQEQGNFGLLGQLELAAAE
jgi:hypothetical protein